MPYFLPKKFKRLLLIFMILFLCLSISGCSGLLYFHDKDKLQMTILASQGLLNKEFFNNLHTSNDIKKTDNVNIHNKLQDSDTSQKTANTIPSIEALANSILDTFVNNVISYEEAILNYHSLLEIYPTKIETINEFLNKAEDYNLFIVELKNIESSLQNKDYETAIQTLKNVKIPSFSSSEIKNKFSDIQNKISTYQNEKYNEGVQKKLEYIDKNIERDLSNAIQDYKSLNKENINSPALQKMYQSLGERINEKNLIHKRYYTTFSWHKGSEFIRELKDVEGNVIHSYISRFQNVAHEPILFKNNLIGQDIQPKARIRNRNGKLLSAYNEAYHPWFAKDKIFHLGKARYAIKYGEEFHIYDLDDNLLFSSLNLKEGKALLWEKDDISILNPEQRDAIEILPYFVTVVGGGNRYGYFRYHEDCTYEILTKPIYTEVSRFRRGRAYVKTEENYWMCLYVDGREEGLKTVMDESLHDLKKTFFFETDLCYTNTDYRSEPFGIKNIGLDKTLRRYYSFSGKEQITVDTFDLRQNSYLSPSDKSFLTIDADKFKHVFDPSGKLICKIDNNRNYKVIALAIDGMFIFIQNGMDSFKPNFHCEFHIFDDTGKFIYTSFNSKLLSATEEMIQLEKEGKYIYLFPNGNEKVIKTIEKNLLSKYPKKYLRVLKAMDYYHVYVLNSWDPFQIHQQFVYNHDGTLIYESEQFRY